MSLHSPFTIFAKRKRRESQIIPSPEVVSSMDKYIVIVAGGRGTRIGGDIPKQFMPLCRKPVLMHTIERMAAAEPQARLIVVLPADQCEQWHRLCREHGYCREHLVVEGGCDRFHSVLNALHHVPDGVLVAIHDGVRPLVSGSVVRQAFATAARCGAAIPVAPVTESLREVEADGSSHAVERIRYRNVQTPQTFASTPLKRAYEAPCRPEFTDDASVFEAAGHEVTLIEGNRENIKITFRQDLALAEMLLSDKSLQDALA